MPEHTPGPWHQYKNTAWGDDGYIQNAVGAHVAYVRNEPTDDAVVGGQRDANIRLIAAAPDLLAALESFDTEGYDDWMERRRAAIAKAKGESDAVA